MAKQYRKKPIVIEAVQWDGKNHEEVFGFILKQAFFFKEDGVHIETLEGEMRADPGDWIIKGVKGEYYPCKPDIFAHLYDPCE